MALIMFTVESPFNAGAEGLANGISQWLAQVGPITIIDLDLWREDSPSYTGAWRARILYQTGAGSAASWKCLFFRSGSWQQIATGASAANQYSALMQAGSTFRPVFTLDLTSPGRRNASTETFIVVGLDTAVNPGAPTAVQVYIGQPTTPVAAGATASVPLLDARGVTVMTVPVKNVGGASWPAGQRSYVVPDALTGLYIAVPTCSIASLTPISPPALTTTTQFASPAYIPQTKPVGAT